MGRRGDGKKEEAGLHRTRRWPWLRCVLIREVLEAEGMLDIGRAGDGVRQGLEGGCRVDSCTVCTQSVKGNAMWCWMVSRRDGTAQGKEGGAAPLKWVRVLANRSAGAAARGGNE